MDTCFLDQVPDGWSRETFSEHGIIRVYEARGLNVARNVAAWYHQRRDFVLHGDYSFYLNLAGYLLPRGMHSNDVQKFLHLHPSIKKYLSRLTKTQVNV